MRGKGNVMKVTSRGTLLAVVGATLLLSVVSFPVRESVVSGNDATPLAMPQELASPDTDSMPRQDPTPHERSSATTRGAVAERLQIADLVYQGAFRLPEEFNWGALGLTYYPPGNDGRGSLLVTGFQAPFDPDHPGESCWNPAWNCYAHYGQIEIPIPAVRTNWEELPHAVLLGTMRPFDLGLAATVHREYVYVSGMEYVPRSGSQTQDKIYGSLDVWYAEGVFGEASFPTVWMANLDGTDARGMFHVGPDSTPYHGRKMGSYLFTVPQWYATRYLGGRRLVTGRSRGTPASMESPTTSGGSQGPTLFAFHPFASDTPTGNLDALPLLYYQVKFPGCAGPNVGDPAACDFPGFTMCDDWGGASFVDNGARRSIMILGLKGLGNNCYDEPPTQCHDPCGDTHGYHCHPYERQVLLYDVHALGEIAQGRRDPWAVLPYAVWRPQEFYLSDAICWNTGGMAFDQQGGRLFMVERGLGGDTNAAVIHVWSVPYVNPGSSLPASALLLMQQE